MSDSFKKSVDIVCLPSDSHGGAENILKQIVAGNFFENELEVIILKKKRTNFWSDLPSNAKIKYFSNSHHYTGFIKLIFYLFIKSFNTNISYVVSSQSYINGLLGFCRKIKFLHCKVLILRESTSPFDRFSGLKLRLYKWPYIFGYSAANVIVCQSETMKQKLIHQFPRLEKKVKVLLNPINLDEANEMGNLQPITNIDLSIPFIVSAGRLINEKGFDLLIKAFNKISVNNKLQLIILGEGILRKELELLINELELNNKVLLPGYCNNVYPYFKLAKLCVVSSRIEGFPNVLLQMMSQNGNVISSLCAGGIESIPALPTFAPNDADALEKSMLQNIHLNEFEIQNRYIIYNKYLSERSLKKFVENLKYAVLNT